MATHIIRGYRKFDLSRQPSISNLLKRNNSTNNNATRAQEAAPPGQQRSFVIPLVVGLSGGLSLALAMNNSKFIDRLLPPDPLHAVVEKPVQARIDPETQMEMINLKMELKQLRDIVKMNAEDARQRERRMVEEHSQQQSKIQRPTTTGDIFELSEIMEASTLAAEKRLRRELEDQRKSLMRESMLKIEAEALRVENKYKPVVNKIKELEAYVETARDNQSKEAPARLLWLSCQSLLQRMKNDSLRPLKSDPAYAVLKQFAANNNPLATTVLDSIPAKALQEGVYSEDSLIERYSKVENICKRVALIDERGGGIARYLASYLQSLLLLENVKISDEEVLGQELVNPMSWKTHEILARVRYCLLKRNLEQAIRYANQLSGQARFVAKDWIRDARVHLELRQAFRVLSTHAEAIAVESL